MVPEQDIGELWYFLATIKDKSDYRVKMGLRSWDVLLIDVLAFPPSKIQFGRSNIISIQENKILE